MITVIHRNDHLLQDNVERGVSREEKGTIIEKVTVPTHRALLRFLDERIVGRTHPSRQKLQRVLDTWPKFAAKCGLSRLAKEFAVLEVIDDGWVACPNEGHNRLVVARVQP